MIARLSVFAVLALLSLPARGLAAEGEKPQSGAQPPADQVFGDIQARTSGDPVLLTQPERYAQWDARFGWWAMWHSGSPAKVGEYQDLNPSPFWDVDGFSSNGCRTLGITATGNDNETTLGKIHYYQPGLTVDFGYQRYLHRRDHDPLDNMAPLDTSLPNNPGGNDPLVMKQDLNVGQDYAVRVQELKGSIKGIYADDNFKVRLDVWGLKKEGTRQADLTAMCYNYNVTNTGPNFPATGSSVPPDHLGLNGANLGTFKGGRCHVLSEAQQINWTTTEIKPVVEWKLGDSFVVEYSRPMRGFTANDQDVTRFYDVTGVLTYNPVTSNNTGGAPNANPYATGVAPDSYTAMDQVKLSGMLNDDNRVYAFLMAGNTVNQEISMNRWFNDMDVRWTNTSLNNVSLTTYGKIYNEAEQMPSLAAVTALETYNNTRTKDFQPSLDAPINYHNTTAGLRGVWRPGGCGYAYGGLAIAGGYEYGDLERANAIFETDSGTPVITVDDSQTITHSFQVGPTYRWSSALDTYLRYKFQDAEQPLIGFKSLNGTFNTILPQHDHIVEVGFDWFPSDWLMFNACIGIERGDNHSQYADFDEENYPMTFSAWYAANTRLSFSAGYAVYSNFVAQNITVGDDRAGTAVPPASGPWNYGGQAHVVTVGSRYCLTECVRLTGDVEWVRGHNQITNSPLQGITLAVPLGTYSEVLNETTRIRVGADWIVRPRVVVYGRYELYNFDDVAPGFQTGLAQGVLGGFSALF